MKKFIAVFVLTLSLIIGGAFSQAGAYTVMSKMDPGWNQASDEDREYLIDRVNTGTVGQLDVGDSLRGSININTLNSAGANLGGLTPGNEFTGIFQVMVSSISAIPVGGGNNLYYFTFSPDPAFEAVYGAGAVVALYEDTVHNYAGDFDDPAPSTPPAGPDDGTTLAAPSTEDVSVGPYASEEAFIALATDGQWFATLGFLGLAGEGMDALTTVPATSPSILQAFTLTSGTTTTNANLALNLLALGPAGTGLNVARVTPSTFGGLVDFALSQQLRGVSDLDTPFEISSNTNISFFREVPEPATLLLLGSGLLGIGSLYGRKKMKK